MRAAAASLRKLAAAATPGPWVACFTDECGSPETSRTPGFDPDDDDVDPDRANLSLVCGTALPDEHGDLPGAYQSIHMLAEHDDDMPESEAAELFGSLTWAATVHPGIGEALAALLDDAAELAAAGAELHPALVPHARWQKPLAVARVLLGETPGGAR